MKYEDALAFFGTAAAMVAALKMCRQNADFWKKTGIITEKSALRLYMITKGEIPYDESIYESKRKHSIAKKAIK